jgi:excisionase family DNA binding protein
MTRDRAARANRVVAFNDRREEAAALAAAALGEVRLTVQQAAIEAAVSEHTIRRAYVYGHLRIQRFGLGQRALRIKRSELEAWLAAGGKTSAPEGTTRR